jgi:hypothetical protein
MRVLIVHRSARDALEAARPILATGAEVVVTTSASQARCQAGQFDRGLFSHDLEDGSGVVLAAELLVGERVATVEFLS